MTIVLVHGVPETPAVWDGVRAALDRTDVTALQLPGFGCPRPGGFGATKEEYVDWLVAELDGLKDHGPVDLVGHDWGGGLLVRLVSTRPELVRSWITDAAGLGDAEFEWHEFAKIWQTPEEGEKFFADQLAQPVEERGAVFEMLGLPKDKAVELAGWLDQTMAGCILDLYRSATEVGQEWGPDFHDIPAPGLVLGPTEDPFQSEGRAESAAARAGANFEPLSGVGHWWMLQDPDGAAALFQRFWSTLG